MSMEFSSFVFVSADLLNRKAAVRAAVRQGEQRPSCSAGQPFRWRTQANAIEASARGLRFTCGAKPSGTGSWPTAQHESDEHGRF